MTPSTIESEEADVFGGDFDDDESSSDGEEVAVTKERRKPALKAPSEKPRPRSRGRRERRDPRETGPTDPSRGFAPAAEADGDFGGKHQQTVGVRAILKRSEEAREAARPSPLRRPANAEPHQLTQAEILAEAAATEIVTSPTSSGRSAGRDAKNRTRREEGRVRAAARAVVQRQNAAFGRAWSRNGAPRMPAPLNEPSEGRETPRCVVSGAAAKYRDPATGLPFRDAAAPECGGARRRRDRYDRGNDTKRLGDFETKNPKAAQARRGERRSWRFRNARGAHRRERGLAGMPPRAQADETREESISLNAP